MAAIRISAANTCDEACKNNFHLIPCKVKYSGEANVAEYFESSIRDSQEDPSCGNDPEVKEASFRGRPLKGKNILIPTDYEGLVLKEERKPYSDEEERTVVPKARFDSFSYWNLENRPTDNDNMLRALKWLEIAHVLHGNQDANEKEGTPEPTQTDR